MDSLSWGEHNTPRSLLPGQAATVTISFRNTSTRTWAAGGPDPVRLSHHWRDRHGNVVVWEGIRTPLPRDIPPGGTVANLTAQMQAPMREGAYVLQWDLVQDGLTWFQAEGAAPLVVPIDVVTPYGVLYESYTTPKAMTRGELTSFTMTLTNIGSLTWSAAGYNPVFLSYHWVDGHGNMVIPNGVRSAFASDVPPGATATITATLQAPPAPGLYALKWDLVQEGVVWFSAEGVIPATVSVAIR